MDRREFLKKLGIGVGAAVVAPMLPETTEVAVIEPVEPAKAAETYYVELPPPFDDFCIEGTAIMPRNPMRRHGSA